MPCTYIMAISVILILHFGHEIVKEMKFTADGQEFVLDMQTGTFVSKQVDAGHSSQHKPSLYDKTSLVFFFPLLCSYRKIILSQVSQRRHFLPV